MSAGFPRRRFFVDLAAVAGVFLFSFYYAVVSTQSCVYSDEELRGDSTPSPPTDILLAPFPPPRTSVFTASMLDRY